MASVLGAARNIPHQRRHPDQESTFGWDQDRCKKSSRPVSKITARSSAQDPTVENLRRTWQTSTEAAAREDIARPVMELVIALTPDLRPASAP
jgi:hypothetical protein